VVLVVLVLLVAEEASFESVLMALLQEGQWCLSTGALLEGSIGLVAMVTAGAVVIVGGCSSRRKHLLVSDNCCWCSGDRRRVLYWKEASAW
jgi:hypothetical protein